ncbi:MAG: hypothetical protein AMXMBFR84_09060 [Candidatus Hydrogenedentota bacterium]
MEGLNGQTGYPAPVETGAVSEANPLMARLMDASRSFGFGNYEWPSLPCTFVQGAVADSAT